MAQQPYKDRNQVSLTVLASVWVKLDEAALCLNDETVFSVRNRECPVCGAPVHLLLAKFLQERTR